MSAAHDYEQGQWEGPAIPKIDRADIEAALAEIATVISGGTIEPQASAGKGTIADMVAEHRAELAAIAGSRKALFQWAIDRDLNTQARFPKFKKALADQGIANWNEIRQAQVPPPVLGPAEKCTAQVALFCAASPAHNQFAIASGYGEPLWYGRFFAPDRDGFDGEQQSGDLSAACKAVWFALKIREASGHGRIRLTLHTDAEWLCEQREGPDVLVQKAARAGVELRMQWVPAGENTANKWAAAPAYKKWDSNDLAALATAFDPDDDALDAGDDLFAGRTATMRMG